MDLDTALALGGFAVPVVAGAWEFVFAGLRRLGYRVQMETAATPPEGGGTGGGRSFVLLRFQNNGLAGIDPDNYVAPENGLVGIRVKFPKRRVKDMRVTECSHNTQWSFFAPDTPQFGIEPSEDAIRLPKVQLNRGWHFKVLVTLEAEPDAPEPAAPPTGLNWFRRRLAMRNWPEKRLRELVVVEAAIKSGGERRIRWTESHTYASPRIAALVAFLVAVAGAQLVLTVNEPRTATVVTPPLDCTKGRLELSGSTAFYKPVAQAAAAYEKRCMGQVSVEAPKEKFVGSGTGLAELEQAGKAGASAPGHGLANRLAFSDSPAARGEHPNLLPTPVALSVFTLVATKDAQVQNLTPEQVRDLYAGRVTNWKDVGGADLPVHLVSRNSDSGTRIVLKQKLLGGRELPGVTESDCAAVPDAKPGRCEVKSTEALLRTMAQTPGALGHSELNAALAHPGLVLVRIDGRSAKDDDVAQQGYPYWHPEYAYSYGDPPAQSPAAGFLLFLKKGLGAGVLSNNDFQPCADFDSPVKCAP
ncbi:MULTISPECIES: PstS family phosphate ABC transporter substrate-binding protein [unclassified Streptomyces]|uniref:PstS family phosphate ABC transporter substrate-binding protein n=1 Tax=unclassified Streptomyces TaxID=2593676 RepID=UPI00278BB0F1|nr:MULTISPECIES: substrate-binding domain-containing protein [unclassified Streptomyces]